MMRLASFDHDRDKVIDEYGLGDIGRGEGDD